MDICPCCRRRIPKSKTQAIDRKYSEDVARARASIAVCEQMLTRDLAEVGPTRYRNDSLRLAIESHLVSLNDALNDPAKLWRIYRRKDKASGYAIAVLPASVSEVAA